MRASEREKVKALNSRGDNGGADSDAKCEGQDECLVYQSMQKVFFFFSVFTQNKYYSRKLIQIPLF